MTVLPSFDPPVSSPHTQPFWDAVEREALAMPRCSVCARWQWYPEATGTDCPGGELVWEDVSPTGRLVTFTRVHRSFLPGRRPDGPYVVGLIELDGVDGPTLVASLDDATDPTIGGRVRARFDRIGDRNHPVFEVLDRG